MENYKAKTRIERKVYTGTLAPQAPDKFYYPVIEYYTKTTGNQAFYLNEPQPTRAKALTIAKQYIKNNQ